MPSIDSVRQGWLVLHVSSMWSNDFVTVVGIELIASTNVAQKSATRPVAQPVATGKNSSHVLLRREPMIWTAISLKVLTHSHEKLLNFKWFSRICINISPVNHWSMQVISLLFILSWSLLAWAGKIISWLLTLFSPLLNHIIILSCFHASPPQKSNKNRRLLSRLRMIFLATSQPSLPCNETHMSITLRKRPFHFFEFFSPPNLSFVSGLFSPLPLERLIDAPLYLEIVGHYQWNTVNIGYIANKWVVRIISKNLFSTVVLRGARA